jgi:hypothetical protein
MKKKLLLMLFFVLIPLLSISFTPQCEYGPWEIMQNNGVITLFDWRCG